MDYYGLLFLYYLKGLSGKSILRLFFNIEVGGTEQLLPENTSTPTTTPILADIQYPDGLRTDQYFTYRETPTTVSNKARIKTIKGNTLVWNQQLLAPTTNGGSSASADGSFRANRCSFTYDSTTHIITITNLENVGTSGFVFGLSNGAPLIVGHKYLLMCDVQAPKTFNFVIGVAGSTDIKNSLSANTYHHVSTIKEFVSNSNEFLFNFNNSNGWAGTETVYIKNAMLFDLTQMGLDISSPSEFTSLFPLPYYAYNQGTLLSFNGNGIKTTGKNLLKTNISSETINGVTFTVNKDENGELTEIIVSGTATQRANFYVLPQGTNNVLSTGRYILSCGFDSQNIYMSSYNTSTGLSYRVYGSGVEVPYVTGEDYSIYISVLSGATANNIIFKPMLRLADVEDATFEPYTSSTLSLPISTYFSNGMKSAGSVYDELTENKAITRVGSVDLGSLTWVLKNIDNPYFYTTANIGQKANGQALCAIYPFVSSTDFATEDKCMRLGAAETIQIRDSSYTSASDFKTAMTDQNVKLYYELATPTETPITTEDANEALSLLMGKSVSSSNANQLIDIITKGE